MAFDTGAMDVEALGKYVKGFAKTTARVFNTNLNKQPMGLLAAFPVDNLSSQKIEHFGQTWAPGMIDQPLDGAGDTSKWKMIYSSKDLTNSWDKQSFKILDSAATAQAANRMSVDGARMVQDYLTACRVYKLIRELKAKRADANTHAAGVIGGGDASVWGSAGAGNAEKDIAAAITKIVSTTGLDLESGQYEFGLLYPSSVLDEFAALNLINLVVTRLKDYLKTAWNITPYPFTPYTDGNGNEYIDVNGVNASDVLGTSALVFVKGEQTMIGGNYGPSDIMLNETSREHSTGYISTFKQCTDYLAVPMDGKSNGKTKLVYEITGVSS
ncbi:TPA_asm: hypothetical protein vir525_00057 [Caudoviricetes sp. vir525]|nr:TPA_asm: hypothetical protein vir525_00057 [Caudoviricetes sp. vir525]